MIMRKQGHAVSLRLEDETFLPDKVACDSVKMRSMSDKLLSYGSERGIHTIGQAKRQTIYLTVAERENTLQAVKDVDGNDHLVNGGVTSGDKLYMPGGNGPKLPTQRKGKSPFKKYNKIALIVERK